MNQNKNRGGMDNPNKGNQQTSGSDQARNPGGPVERDRSQADDQGLRRKPESEPAVPDTADDIDEDRGSDRDVHTEATMPPGEGQDPKRNTL